MKKALLAALALALGTTAWAGQKIVAPVTINTTSRWASGAFGSARNSGDSIQYIGCYIYGDSGGVSDMWCYAGDAAGHTASCATVDDNLIKVLRSVTDSSNLYFAWDAGGTCTAIQVSVWSRYEPKQP